MIKTVVFALMVCSLLYASPARAAFPDVCEACAGECGQPCGNGGNVCPLNEVCSNGNCLPVCDPIACDHDPRYTGDPLTAGCAPGVSAACAIDSWCCTHNWDMGCVGEAGYGYAPYTSDQLSPDCAPPSPTSPPRTPACYGACSHDYCQTGAGLAPNCYPDSSDNCVQLVTWFKPACGDTSNPTGWDAECIALIKYCNSGDKCW